MNDPQYSLIEQLPIIVVIALLEKVLFNSNFTDPHHKNSASLYWGCY